VNFFFFGVEIFRLVGGGKFLCYRRQEVGFVWGMFRN